MRHPCTLLDCTGQDSFDSISLEKGFTGASSMKAGTRHCTLPMLLGEMQADASVKIIKDLGVIDPTGQCG